jgi:hypothetical protein
MPKPPLTISDESAAEMVAALIFAETRGKPSRIAKRLSMMRTILQGRAVEQKVVRMHPSLCPRKTKARADEAAARLDRVEVILREIAGG